MAAGTMTLERDILRSRKSTLGLRRNIQALVKSTNNQNSTACMRRRRSNDCRIRRTRIVKRGASHQTTSTLNQQARYWRVTYIASRVAAGAGAAWRVASTTRS